MHTDRQTIDRQTGRVRVAFRICCVKGSKNKVFTKYSKIIINLLTGR